MMIKSVTLKGIERQFDVDAKKILVIDSYENFNTIINYLFRKTQVYLFDPIFLQRFTCEVFGYGQTIFRTVECVSEEKIYDDTIKRNVDLRDVTYMPSQSSLPRFIRRLAQRDFQKFFYSDICRRNLCFFYPNEKPDFIDNAIEYFLDPPDNKYCGFTKKDREKMSSAAEIFKRSFAPIDLGFEERGFEKGIFDDEFVPYVKPFPAQNKSYAKKEKDRIRAVYDFFVGNALCKSAYDAIGKDVPPLFLFNALDELSENAVHKILDFADTADRQVIFVESYDNEQDSALFDQIINFVEEE